MLSLIYEKGGFIMFPLAFCSIILILVAFERLWFFRSHRSNSDTYLKAMRFAKAGDMDQAKLILYNSKGAIESVFHVILSNLNHTRHDLEHIASNKGIQELQKFYKNLHIIELIGRIAPMLGLAGTVVGMVSAFQAMATATGAINPALLANGIWESLLTTVVGLFIGIPALVIYHFFEKALHQKTLEIKVKAEDVIITMSGS